MTPQQRLFQMEQQYPQLAQPSIQPNSNTINSLTTIPVTNIEEANAFRVDLNGTPTFFYNAGKGEVYLKRTNTQTGLADFVVFGKVEHLDKSKQTAHPDSYEKDFKALNDKIDSFSHKIDSLYSLFATAKEQNAAIGEVEETKVRGSKHVK